MRCAPAPGSTTTRTSSPKTTDALRVGGGDLGALSRPQNHAGDRGASWLCRDAPSVGGLGGPFRGHKITRVIEGRHGYAGTSRALGGLGALSRPQNHAGDRGAAWLRRDAPSVGGLGGPVGGPKPARGSAGGHGQ